ncbi:hypothetical protein D3C87_991890 [compost metagenome]
MYSDAPYSHEPYSTVAPVNAGVLAVSQVVTAFQGEETVRFTYTVTGQAITSQQGEETVKTAYNVLGQQINSVQGMVTVRAVYTPTGQVINGVLGDETVLFGAVIYPSGNVMTGVIGPPTIETRYYLTGQQMQLRLGNELIWSLVDDSAPTVWTPVIVS